MARTLAGDFSNGWKRLWEEDVQAHDWHQHISGIDFYSCFVIKHQMHKFFYFDRVLPRG